MTYQAHQTIDPYHQRARCEADENYYIDPEGVLWVCDPCIQNAGVREVPSPQQAMPRRTAVELGVFAGGRERWLCLSASTEDALKHYIDKAIAKGWNPIDLYEGIDPATGWPSVWMKKPVVIPSNNSVVETKSQTP
jgi:hypothetical protein